MFLQGLEVSQLLKQHHGDVPVLPKVAQLSSEHNPALLGTYLDAASSSYLQRSSSSSVCVAFSAGKRKRRVSCGVGAWPCTVSSPCPGPTTCVEHFDLLLCLPQPSGQGDLSFLQAPARDGHQGWSGGTAEPTAPQNHTETPHSIPSSTPSLTGARKDPPVDNRMCPSCVTPQC